MSALEVLSRPLVSTFADALACAARRSCGMVYGGIICPGDRMLTEAEYKMRRDAGVGGLTQRPTGRTAEKMGLSFLVNPRGQQIYAGAPVAIDFADYERYAAGYVTWLFEQLQRVKVQVCSWEEGEIAELAGRSFEVSIEKVQGRCRNKFELRGADGGFEAMWHGTRPFTTKPPYPKHLLENSWNRRCPSARHVDYVYYGDYGNPDPRTVCKKKRPRPMTNQVHDKSSPRPWEKW